EHLDVVMTSSPTASTLVRVAGIGVREIYSCHALHWNGQRLVDLPFRVIYLSFLSPTDAIVCSNSADGACSTRHAPRIPRLRLLGGVGLGRDRFVRRPALTWEEGTEPLRLVWCGEFSPRKNPAAVVELATILHRRGIDVTLDMLGEGPLFDSEEARS